jgi:RHS repeat-associated protein
MPAWARGLAVLLIFLQFLSCGPLPVMQAWASAGSAGDQHPAPVHSPKSVKINHSRPQATTKLDFNLHFSALPTDAELEGVSLFSERLVIIGQKTSSPENRALAAAITTYSQGKDKENVTPLTTFLDQYPQSGWNASLLTNLGIIYRAHGYYSRALTAWKQAWTLAKNATAPDTHALADRAVAEYARLLSSLGRTEELQPLLKEVHGRKMYGLPATMMISAGEALAVMQKEPGISFKCGPYALGNIQAFLQPKQPIHPVVFKAASGVKGFSLSQLRQLSGQMNLNYQVAKRQPGAALIVPSVVHWKSGHYAAVVQAVGGKYLVKDPTFEGDVVFSQEAIDDEASGYFLIPAGTLPKGWTAVGDSEGKTIFGRGFPGPRTTSATTTRDVRTQPSRPACGMSRHSILSLLACLHIEDTPVGYTPPVGPDVHFTIAYNQYEASQPGSFVSFNFGSDWVSSWSSYIPAAPTSVGTSVSVTLNPRGGGFETYAGSSYTGSSTTGNYGPLVQGQIMLYVLPTTNPLRSSDPNQLRFERHLPDGSVEVYDSPSDSQGNIFLTQIIDPQNNALTLNYSTVLVGSQNDVILTSLTDAIGQTTTISYGLTGDSLKITQITDPFGRSASFQYTTASPYQLVSITDVVGITSQFTYSPGTNAITALTTPYGTTTFLATTSASVYGDPIANRTLLVTDPDGGQEKAYARYEPDTLTYTPVEPLPRAPFVTNQDVDDPDGTDNNLEEMNTYYWDKKAMLDAPNSLTAAHVDHWLANSLDGAGPVPYSQKNALESRVWYNYTRDPNYSDPYDMGLSDRPTGLARILSDGTTQISTYAYNPLGYMTQQVDPNGRTFTYDYAANNIDLLDVRQTQGTNNDALVELTYNGSFPPHCPQSIIDASGQTTQFQYNTQGQVTRVTNAYPAITTYTYTGPNGSGAGNYLTQINGPAATAGAGDTTSYTYDAYGRVHTATDSQGYVLTYDYDALDRLTVITYPDGTSDQYNYSNLDLAWHKDRLGRWTHNTYNALEQLLTTTDPLGRTTIYNWCVCGALNSVTDPAGNVTSYGRDVEARTTSQKLPDGTQYQYVYDTGTGALAWMIDPAGQVATYSYNHDDTLGGITYSKTTHATPSVSYTYDPNYVRITQMQDGTGATNYTYKPYSVFSTTSPPPVTTGVGLLATEAGPLANATIAYTYDALGRATTTTLNGSANSMGVTFDALGRVTNDSNLLGSFTTGYLSTTARPTSLSYPNGMNLGLQYFPSTGVGDERLQELDYTNSSSAVISKFDYTYNPVGEITSWQRQADANTPTIFSLSYDGADQLSEALLTQSGTAVHRYVENFNSGSNRTSEQIDLTVTSGSNNSLNELTGLSGGGPVRVGGTVNQPSTVTVNGTAATTSGSAFTAQVNLSAGTDVVSVVAVNRSGLSTTNNYHVTIPTASGSSTRTYDLNGNLLSDGTRTYQWDAANRLTAINNGTASSLFTYDGLGRRVKIVEETSGTVTSTKQLVWVGADIVEERNASDTVTKRFYPQGEQIGSTSYYYTRDHLGSVRELLNSSQTVQARYDYDPYGRTTLVSGTNLSDFQYAGYYLHQPSGDNLTLFRAYDPNTARWLSRDPVDSNNLYAYGNNDPFNSVDPLGLCSLELARPVYSPDANTFTETLPEPPVLRTKTARPPPIKPPGITTAAAAPNPSNGENENTARGREAHKWWQPPEGYSTTFRFENGLRPDAINIATKHIIELKPNNPEAIAKGLQQLQKYIKAAQDEFGGIWTGSVQTY